MINYCLRPEAEEDLFNIFAFTIETWGLDQAQRYIRDLDSMFDSITETPQLGMACDGIRSGYRRHPCGKHMIYYRITDTFIDVVRILHHHQDAEQALSDAIIKEI